MPSSVRGSAFLNVMATISVGLAAVMVWRVFFPPTRIGEDLPATVYQDNWRELAVGRHQFGPADAPVTIIEFADFECPACRVFNLEVLAPLRQKHAEKIRWVFRHWPLSYHRFAAPAARAAECAADQGRFEAFHDAVYRWQDSLGLIAWGRYAVEAGIDDTAAFAICNSVPGPNPVAEADAKVATELHGRGTPLLIINGVQLPGVPSRIDLNQMIDSMLAARQSSAIR